MNDRDVGSSLKLAAQGSFLLQPALLYVEVTMPHLIESPRRLPRSSDQ